MKVCTAHDAHSSEVHRAEALLGTFFVSSFSAFLSKGLHFSLSLIKARNCRNLQKCGRLEALKKIRKCGKIRKIPIPGSGSIFQRLAHIGENLEAKTIQTEANRFDNSYFNNNGNHSGTTVRFTIALQCGSFLGHVYNFSQRLSGLA